jgi:hypothetical protein
VDEMKECRCMQFIALREGRDAREVRREYDAR